jgi:hypothetical protein
MAPAAVQDPYEALSPHPLSEYEIEELVVAFAHAIRRTKVAGLDAAEIHGAHGYLVNEFLSPYFNRRTDRWARRARIVSTGEERRREGVTVVLACGLVADGSLASALEGRVAEVHVIGDALAPRRIMHATLEGARAARTI